MYWERCWCWLGQTWGTMFLMIWGKLTWNNLKICARDDDDLWTILESTITWPMTYRTSICGTRFSSRKREIEREMEGTSLSIFLNIFMPSRHSSFIKIYSHLKPTLITFFYAPSRLYKCGVLLWVPLEILEIGNMNLSSNAPCREHLELVEPC